eukprot:scaffold46646_cov63-Phaeocystis_antarctica.AAC.2
MTSRPMSFVATDAQESPLEGLKPLVPSQVQTSLRPAACMSVPFAWHCPLGICAWQLLMKFANAEQSSNTTAAAPPTSRSVRRRSIATPPRQRRSLLDCADRKPRDTEGACS